MHPFLVLEHLKENFKNYVLSKYPWNSADPEYKKLEELCLTPGQVFQDPVIQLDRPRKKTPKLSPHEPEFFSQKLRELLHSGFPPRSKEGKMRSFNEPFLHQIQAWERISNGEPTVVSTGTGSGKSEAFMFPLLDRVYKAKEQARATGSSNQKIIRAIVIYPMNALIEDQHIRFCRYAYQLGLKVGVYNGSFNEQKKKNDPAKFKDRITKGIFGENADLISDEKFTEITEWINVEDNKTYPDILLTNYAMLQFMLLRKNEHEIFKFADIKALALDEAHLYSGTLGLEMAALLARLKTHIEGLDGSFENCVPVATSATLLRGGEADSVERMRDFFESLFSIQFSDGWLIQDQFENPEQPDPALWANLKLPLKTFSDAMSAAKADVPEATTVFKNSMPQIENLESIAAQLPTILLSDLKPNEPVGTQPLHSVTSMQDAVHRFSQWRRGNRSPSAEEQKNYELEIKSLLSLSAMAQKTESSPLLGVRLHAFVRSEPRLYRSFNNLSSSGKIELGGIMSEDEVTEYTSQSNDGLFALPAAFCKTCGHEGWITTAQDLGNGNELELTPLTRQPLPDDQIIVLHPVDIESEQWPKDWRGQYFQVTATEQGTFLAKQLLQKARGTRNSNPLMNETAEQSPDERNSQKFLRIERTTDKGIAQDNTHCPNCLSTHKDEQMRVSRGSASSDLSVHTRHLLAAAEDDGERRLLMFCDNRQDTSFLSGFLTDRHKRFRLRRAIYQAIANNREKQKNLQIVDHQIDHNSYPFAEAVLSELKRALGDDSATEIIPTKTLRQCLTSDLFDFKETDFDQRLRRLIDSTEPSSLVRTSQSAELDYDLKRDSPEGKFALKLLTEGILRDLSLGAYKEGALGTLGMACLWSSAIGEIKTTEERLLAWKIFSILKNEGQWTDRPKGLKQSGYNTDSDLHVDELIRKMTSAKNADLRKFIEKNCPSLNQGEETEKKLRDLLKEWDEIGLIHIDVKRKNKVYILSRNLVVCPKVAVYKSNIKKKKETVPSDFDLSGIQATRKQNDNFEKIKDEEKEIPEAWKKLYAERSAIDNFVKAREHNAMIDSSIATAIIETFAQKSIQKRSINTVVATPTLEMGIDLPDLPAVIHRSVPPDPNNYAQRSGRAGRDKKRALLLAHCGRGSHDSAYFMEPEAMVAGEIIPPGCPRANTTVLTRHINALCLQYLAECGMTVNLWDSYLNRGELFNWMKTKVGLTQKTEYENIPVFNWREIITAKNHKENLQERITKIVNLFDKGLWKSDLLNYVDKQTLEGTLRKAIENDEFAERLDVAIREYNNLILEKKNKYESLPDMKREKYAILADIKSLLGGFGDDRNTITPVSWFQIRGILPNFDFPSDVATFTGFRTRDAESAKDKRHEVAVRFSRALNQAMREFCPEKSLYAAGSKFKVTKYSVDRSSMNRQEQSFGVCLKGCTHLTPLNDQTSICSTCGSPLVGQTEHKTKLPPIFRLVRAEGNVTENIGDSSPEKDNTQLVRESLVVGGTPGERVKARAEELGRTTIRKYVQHKGKPLAGDKAGLLDLMMIVGARSKSKDGNTARNINPLFASSNESDEFYVSLNEQDEDEHNTRCIHPFLLGNRFSAEGLHFLLDFEKTGFPSGEDVIEKQYVTFQATLLKAIRRELFLGPRSQTLDSFTDVSMNCSGDEEKREINGVYFFDTLPGGSGVMALVRQNWKAICHRAHRIVTESTCCDSACKRCIATFDNQYRHSLLDRRLLHSQTDKNDSFPISIFNLISDFFDHDSQNWVTEQQSPNDLVEHEEGDDQFAEQRLRECMAEMLPNLRFTEQNEVHRLFESSPITIPDVIIQENEKIISIFVDGYKHHGKKERFISDIHKRNFLTAVKGFHSFTIPAGWLTAGENQRKWGLVADSIKKRIDQTHMQIPQTQRATLGIDEKDFDIPEAFEQYNWLFDSPPRKIEANSLETHQFMRMIGYHADKRILVVETDVHCNTSPDGMINKQVWHVFWEQLNQIQLKYGRTFVLIKMRS